MMNKYDWHDLRLNENDLPEENELVITCVEGTDVIVALGGESLEDALDRVKNYNRYTSCGFYTHGDGWYGADGYPEIVYPIAWKYIEPFIEA